MRTQKQIEANYTELVHAGEGIEIEKGKISATGSGGSGGASNIVVIADYDGEHNVYNFGLAWSDLVAGIAKGGYVVLLKTDNYDSFTIAYSDLTNIAIYSTYTGDTETAYQLQPGVNDAITMSSYNPQ